MLSVFPIMFLSLLAHTILRLCVGLVVFGIARSIYRHGDTYTSALRRSAVYLFALSLAVASLSLFVGFLAQIAALYLALIAALGAIRYAKFGSVLAPRSTLFLICGACLSLCITGAGAFAFDMPF